jgi:hypothetical protein
MPYDANDPRARLGTTTGSAPEGGYGTSEHANFYETSPQIESSLERTWLTRGQNFLVAYSQFEAGGGFVREDQVDEYIVLLPDAGVPTSIVAGEEEVRSDGRAVVVVPPGPSELRIESRGRVVAIFTTLSDDLAQRCVNADSYRVAKPNVAKLEPWPDPVGGFRLRCYDLDVEPEPGRFGRIWRTSNLMVNHSEPRLGPRDVTKMSPHTHEDFEQGSLCLGGSFVHHLRWPWGTDMRHWRPDEHVICAGPSLAVIPPLVLHTSQQVSQGINQLVDIFSPPRRDFSEMPGWVLNADEYPVPS